MITISQETKRTVAFFLYFFVFRIVPGRHGIFGSYHAASRLSLDGSVSVSDKSRLCRSIFYFTVPALHASPIVQKSVEVGIWGRLPTVSAFACFQVLV